MGLGQTLDGFVILIAAVILIIFRLFISVGPSQGWPYFIFPVHDFASVAARNLCGRPGAFGRWSSRGQA